MAPPLANLGRARRYMDAGGLDALITWSPANVRYLTGYWCWLAPLFQDFMVRPGGDGALALRNIAVAPRDGEPLLVVESLWGLNASDSWVEDVRLAGGRDLRAPDEPAVIAESLAPLYRQLTERSWPADVFDALAEALLERGLSCARLGVEMDGATAAEIAGLRARLPRAELLDCTNLLRLVRAVKTDGEIARLTRAAEIAEEAAMTILGSVRPGVSVEELVAEFRLRAAQAGADLDHFALAPRGLGFAAGGPVTIEHGDALYVDFGVIWGGWFSDSGTTVCVGAASERTLEQFAAVRDCVAAGAAALRPGEPASAAAAAMREALGARGITESFPHGHGLGIEVRDYPLIMPDNGGRIADECVSVPSDLILEENMVVNLEAPVLTPGVRSVHCEQTFVLTGNGARPLTRQDREAPVVSTCGSR
jgi:Xaa-Pro dipeptidase